MEKILFIDDDPNMRKLVKTALQDSYEVVVASTGEEGITMAVNHNPALVLIDIMMPGLSGYDVLMKLRQVDHMKQIPILAITAYDEANKEERAKTLGFDEYIVKPVRMKKLQTIIRSYLVGDLRHPLKEEINPALREYSVDLIDRLQSTIEDLRIEKRFSESVIQSLSSGLMILDLDSRIIAINHEGKKTLSVFSEQIEGEKLSDVIGNEKAAAFTGPQGNDFFLREEISLQTLQGEEKILGFTTAPRVNAVGEVAGTIVSFRDITDIKYIQKELEKMNKLSTMAEVASSVAHEIRNPLAGIKTMTQAIEENLTENDENREYVRRIIKQVDRLNEILKGFFTYARPAEPVIEKTTLVNVINEIKPLVENRIKQKNIFFSEHYERDIPKILADPSQLQQVFLNLMLNALEASDSGGTIEISVQSLKTTERETYSLIFPKLKEKHNYIKVEFSDNGCGMSSNTAERIFEPFFTTKHNGTGLGLSIIYRILQENNSAIFVNSRKGEGTTFIIFLETE